MTMSLERLQKVIAQSGYTSRRKAEQLIVDKRVKVNGQTISELGTKVSYKDTIEVDGIPLELEPRVYILLNKPRGYISSVNDDRGRKVVTDLINDDIEERLFPVGRLDYNTSGLLLLTNDGDFAQKMIHPSNKVDKVYVAKINGIINKEDITKLKKGIFDKGEHLKCVNVRILKIDKLKKKSIVEITLHQGKNRQVRRMFEAIGYRVEKLKREKFGSLSLERLNPGEYRKLTFHEINKLLGLKQR